MREERGEEEGGEEKVTSSGETRKERGRTGERGGRFTAE